MILPLARIKTLKRYYERKYCPLRLGDGHRIPLIKKT